MNESPNNILIKNIKEYKSIQNKNLFNLGIEILRMILCFWVITFHFSGVKNKTKYKILNIYFHVPTFMIISFYFTYKLFASKNIVKLKKRLERLIIPYILIPIIYLIIIIIFSKYYKNFKYIIGDLLLQYITGYNFYVILWFIQILILFNIIFGIIFLYFKINPFYILKLLAILSYWLQYNEINYILFANFSPPLRSVSHFVEMMPIAVTGITLGSKEILEKLKNCKKNSIILCLTFLYFIYNYNIFGDFKGFFYSGLKQNFAGICLFIIFSLIPFEKIKKNSLINIIRIITRYTGGIYYFQSIIGFFLTKINYLQRNCFFSCFIIYILGYFICLIGLKIFKNNCLRYLFI